MTELLQVENLSAGYGEAVILDGRFAVAGRGRDPGAAGPQRHRQDHADQHARGRHAPAWRHHHAGRRRAAQAAVARARRGRHRLGAAGAQHLQVADGAREPDGRGAARAVDAGRGSTRCSRGWPSARATWARSCRAASSRCWPWAARWCSIRACCCWTSRWKAWRRSSCKELLRAIARITREEGLSAIIVEQHPQAILAISHRAVVLDHGDGGAFRRGRANCATRPNCWTGCWAWRATMEREALCRRSRESRTRRRWRRRSSPWLAPARRPFPPGPCGSSCPMRRAARPTSRRARWARRWPLPLGQPVRRRQQAGRGRRGGRRTGGAGRAGRPHAAAGIQRHGGERRRCSSRCRSTRWRTSRRCPCSRTFDLALVVAEGGRFKTLAELLAWARANPGKLNIGTPQVGTTQNLAAELFKTTAGIEAAGRAFQRHAAGHQRAAQRRDRRRGWRSWGP